LSIHFHWFTFIISKCSIDIKSLLYFNLPIHLHERWIWLTEKQIIHFVYFIEQYRNISENDYSKLIRFVFKKNIFYLPFWFVTLPCQLYFGQRSWKKIVESNCSWLLFRFFALWFFWQLSCQPNSIQLMS